MAKRFTDNQKWSKSWFMDLEPRDKLLWIYMTDSCDHAGVWEINWKLTSFMVGFQVAKLPDSFEKQVYKINEKKYFIKDFIDFQYGQLSENNRAHNSVLTILNKYMLIKRGAYMPLTSPFQGGKDKDKDKDKDKVKDKEKRGKKEQLADINIDSLITEFENVDVSGEFKKWQDWMLAHGKTYKSYNAAFKNWLRSDFVKTKEGNGIKKVKLICPEHHDITVHTERGTVKYCVKCRHLMKSESELALIKIQDNV